jgi:hypothetical protein
MDISISTFRLGDVQVNVILLDPLPFEPFGGWPGYILGYVIDPASLSFFKHAAGNVSESPVADPAVAGVGTHDRTICGSSFAHQDDGAAFGVIPDRVFFLLRLGLGENGRRIPG